MEKYFRKLCSQVLGVREWRKRVFYETHPRHREKVMDYIQLANGKYAWVNGKSGYSALHGMYGNNEYEETRLVNEIVDEKLSEFSERIEAVLEKSIIQVVEEYGRQVWGQLIEQLVGVLQTDIRSEVKIGVDGLRDVFYGEKCQQFISDSIMKSMKNELSKIKNIKLR